MDIRGSWSIFIPGVLLINFISLCFIAHDSLLVSSAVLSLSVILITCLTLLNGVRLACQIEGTLLASKYIFLVYLRSIQNVSSSILSVWFEHILSHCWLYITLCHSEDMGSSAYLVWCSRFVNVGAPSERNVRLWHYLSVQSSCIGGHKWNLIQDPDLWVIPS